MPLTNDGRYANGSEPTVIMTLGTSRSTYHYYHPEYRVSTLYCADAFAGKSSAWLMAYPWIAYCAPFPRTPAWDDMSPSKCGKCLRLTNNRTGARSIVRVVDMCGHSAIDSDYKTAFIPLDTDGQGYLDGQIYVTVEVVVCGGPPS